MVSLARTLDRIATQNGTPTGDYFFERLKPNPKPLLPADPNEAHPDIVGPWSADTIAEARLRWYHSQSDGDLGEKSAQDALVYRIVSGGGGGGGSFERIAGEVTAKTPDEWRLHAAARAREIRGELAQLSNEHQAIIELCFSLRRPDPQVLVKLHGADEKLEPVITFMRRTGRLVFGEEDGKLVVLVNWTRVELSSVLDDARALRTAAIRAYEVAARLVRVAPAPSAGINPSFPAPHGARRAQRPPKRREIGPLIPVGPRGASKRRFQLVEPM
jgi:hypothetical protein